MRSADYSATKPTWEPAAPYNSKVMQSNEIRQRFLDYFARNGHTILPSSSLIPHGDKTILFTNAGMNQFKNAFLGLEKRAYTRAATAQKVMRISGKHNDLENVGPSKRHHTFFEMLGNFSLGDYFKVDAMKFALELLEGEYGFSRERLWFTIYKDDDESEALWRKVGVQANRILRFGEKDNFWSMGPTGPCGPNSEIHYFTGKAADNDARWVNNDDDVNETTVEIWNLVFMQFNRDEAGKLHPLPQTGVDTGLGFERLCRLIMGGDSNYDTDLFLGLMDRTQQLARQTSAQRSANDVAYRVIADHARAAAFLIGDGVLPGNEGRSYALRMVMRRAMRFGRTLGLEEPFLNQICDAVITHMSPAYPDLEASRARIIRTVLREEERFDQTLDQGLELLERSFAGLGGATALPGEVAFKLYDTFGLPIEITRDVARERQLTIDETGFEQARQTARDLARSASKEKFVANYDQARAFAEAGESLRADGALPASGINYNPYGPLKVSTRLAGLLREGELTASAVTGERIEVIVAETPFYVEGGGQVSDTGAIEAVDGKWSMRVLDMRRPASGLVSHVCEVIAGSPAAGDLCVASVDEARRKDIMRNHTVTHLAQKALRTILGTHVEQHGSLVAPDRMRFDFSHSGALAPEELAGVTGMVNAAILANLAVSATEQRYTDAIAGGAMALFSEKYGDVVRVVKIGPDDERPYSAELCGGTHVGSTGEIGSAVVLSESAVAAGVRRLELATGRGSLEAFGERVRELAAVAEAIGASPDRVAEQAGRMAHELSETRKALERAQKELGRIRFEAILGRAETLGGIPVLVARVEADSPETLRDMSDWFRERSPGGVAAFGAVAGERPAIVIAVPAGLVKRGLDAGKLIRDVAGVMGGGGGGRPTFAQGSGKDPARLDDALARARALIGAALETKA